MNVKVTKITQTTMADASNRAVPAFAVTYTIGDHGPFTHTFPQANFSATVVKAELQKMAQHIAELGA